MSTMSHEEFKDLNWLPVICRLKNALFQSCLNLSMTCSFYLNEIFEFAPPPPPPPSEVKLVKGIISWNLNDLFEIQTPFKKPYLLLTLCFGIKSQKY